MIPVSFTQRGENVLLTKRQILEVQDLPTEDVNVPEWGGVVRVQGMSGSERDAFEMSVMTGKGKDRDLNLKNFRAKLVSRCIVDEQGNRVFGEADIAALGGKSALALQRLFDVAQKLSGLSPADVDELTKNLGGGQSGDSPSV